MKEFSIQQYTCRPLIETMGLMPVLEKIKEFGYSGVEFCFFGGFDDLKMSAKEFGQRLDDIGLKMIGNHFGRKSFFGSHEEAFKFIKEAGGRYAIYNSWGEYKTEEDIVAAGEYLNPLGRLARDCGIELIYHNHAPEFATLNGRLVIDRLLEQFDGNLALETDVYFASGQIDDVCGYIRRNNENIRVVHIKQRASDGKITDLPDGILDMRAISDCATCATDFVVEQHDNYPISVMDTLRRNAEYMKAL